MSETLCAAVGGDGLAVGKGEGEDAVDAGVAEGVYDGEVDSKWGKGGQK